MNKQAILFTTTVIIFLAGYLAYDTYFNNEKKILWDFVSNDAGIVVEFSLSNRIEESDLLNLHLDRLTPLINKQVDSIFFKDLRNRRYSKVLVSLHRVSNTATGLTFVIDVLNVSKSELLEYLSVNLDGNTSRKYLDQTIFEKKVDNDILSFQIIDNTLLLTKNAFLIEDVIRLSTSDQSQNFMSNNAEIMMLPKLANDAANIYINWERLAGIKSTFESNVDNTIQAVLKSVFLDAELTSEGIFLSGFSHINDDNFLATFREQTPINDRFDYIIPANAASVTKYLTSNALKWESHLIEYWTKHEPEYLLERNDFIKSFNINRSQFFSSIDKGVCAIDFYDTPNNDKLIFVSIHDSGSVLNQLNTLAENVARLESDSVYIEKYADYLIYELKVDDFPKFLLGPQHDGFSTTYYMIVDDHLIIGSSITTLKSLLAKIDSEETWGRQRKYDELISKGLEEVNLSYSFNTQQLWPLLLRNLNSKWKQVVIENALYIKQFGLGSIQFSRIDDSFYSNILLLHSKAIKTKAKNNIKVNKSLAFNHPLTTRPFVVKNHNTNLLETLVQDSLNNLHLIGNNGKKLWTLSLDDQLLGKVSQIDYYKNKKLQYFLVTKHTLYIVDRLGNIIESFPKPLPFEAVSAAVIDYDNSKNYRFLINDIKGNIYLLNKQGEPLEGWAPLEVEGIHSFTPFHQRVRGRDGFIYLLRNGILNMVSRRAEKIKGFPLELDGVFETRSFVSIGTDYKTTYITVVSKDGKVVEVNFKGELLTENQLFKQTKDAEFRLVPDALNKTFILVRQEKNRLAILDNEGTEMFSKDYLSDGQLKVQYYYFTPEKQVCAITDIDQGLTYLYTLNGELLNSVPINSSKEVGIIYSEVKNEYTLYTVSGDTFQILKF